MTIQLFADSASDLPLSFFHDEQQATLIPLRVHINGEEYDDLLSIDPLTLYQNIRSGATPKTSQASPIVLEQLFSDLAKNGKSGIYPAFSSGLSGTYQTAVMVRDQVKESYPDLDLTIIDTKAASLGYGLIVYQAAQLIQKGASKEEIIADIHFRSQHMEQLFTVEDLEFLAKGGRVSRSAAFIGGLLNIKPLLNVEEGKLIPLEKLRGRKKVLKRMLDLMDERGKNLSSQLIGISHGDDLEFAEELKGKIRERFGCEHFYINTIGSAVGSHSGPEALALFFLSDTPSS